jgi:hypothetical protein
VNQIVEDPIEGLVRVDDLVGAPNTSHHSPALLYNSFLLPQAPSAFLIVSFPAMGILFWKMISDIGPR